MITIIGRRLVIPDCDRVLGVVGDKNVPIKIKVSMDTLNRYFDNKNFNDVAIILKLKHENSNESIAPILCGHSTDGIYVGDVSIASDAKAGLVTAQALIIAPGSAAKDYDLNDAEGLWQSDEDYFYVSDDIALKDYASDTEEYAAFHNLLGALSAKLAETYAPMDEHIASIDNPHRVKAEQVSAYTKDETDSKINEVSTVATDAKIRIEVHENDVENPHSVTAEQVGAYNVQKTDELLSGKVSKNEVAYAERNFAWTDFEFTIPDNDPSGYVLADRINIGGTSHPFVIRCAGATLGFTFSVSGYSDAAIVINGKTYSYTNSALAGSEFASNIRIEPTYMKSDIELIGGMTTWKFTDMTRKVVEIGDSVKVDNQLDENSANPVANKVICAKFASIDNKIGDVDEALDVVLSIQDSLIDGVATLPGEENPEPLE